MSFITQEDFKVVSSEASLKAITGADPDNISNAIAEAQEEVAGYLQFLQLVLHLEVYRDLSRIVMYCNFHLYFELNLFALSLENLTCLLLLTKSLT